jgi:DNA-binding transcriptional regulator LsrR (DeoR family)
MTKKAKAFQKLVSAPEIASALGISSSCARRMISSGMIGNVVALNCSGHRRHLRVRRSDFEAYVSRNQLDESQLPFDE